MSTYLDAWKKRRTALDAMLQKAMRLGLTKGVAVIALEAHGLASPELIEWMDLNVFERSPDPDKSQDKGSNYLGIALEKYAKMRSTRCPSGPIPRPARVGENDWLGGIVVTLEDGRIYLGYSGGTEEQDVEIALAGREAILE
ncbi:hypothetical protein KA005_67785 [bacterium]|nr:hypothetical protein [bacterium]